MRARTAPYARNLSGSRPPSPGTETWRQRLLARGRGQTVNRAPDHSSPAKSGASGRRPQIGVCPRGVRHSPAPEGQRIIAQGQARRSVAQAGRRPGYQATIGHPPPMRSERMGGGRGGGFPSLLRGSVRMRPAKSMQAFFACVHCRFRVNLTSIIGCIGCCLMKLDELRPNKILRGPLFPEPVQVIVTMPMGAGVRLIRTGGSV